MALKNLLNSTGIIHMSRRRLRLICQFKYPRFIGKCKLFFLTLNVRSIEGFILKKISEDTSSLLTLFADKLKVRDHVATTVGNQYLTSLIGTFDTASEIRWDQLPCEFAMKCTHASGGILIVSKQAPRRNLPLKLDSHNWGKYIIHPDDLEVVKVEKFFHGLLNQKYEIYTDYFEFAYSGVTPKIIVEELLSNEEGQIPSDLKFWCSKGEVLFIQLDLDRFGNHLRNFYTKEWVPIEVKLSYHNTKNEIPCPPNLDEMIDISRKLSISSKLVRVDLYDLGERVIFGELTNYPGGGVEKFHPRRFSKYIYKNNLSKLN
jgi:hypothetical protein